MDEVDRWFQPLGLSNSAAPRGSILRLHGVKAPDAVEKPPQIRPQGETASEPRLCRAKFRECQRSAGSFPQLMMDMQMRVDQWRVQISQVVPGDFERVELLARLDALERLIQPTLPKLFRRAVEDRRAAEQSLKPSHESSRRRELFQQPLGYDVLHQQPLARPAGVLLSNDEGDETPLAEWLRRSDSA